MGTYTEGNSLAERLRSDFGFDFVGVSLVSSQASGDDTLAWDCVAGNTNNRYQRIFLPTNVGVLGTVYAEGRPLVVDDAHRDIARDSYYQYPIVSAEGIVSFVGFPLFKKGDAHRFALGERGVIPQYICICAYRTFHPLQRDFIDDVQSEAEKLTGLEASEQGIFHPVHTEKNVKHGGPTHGIIQAQEAERKRIARELHDGISQELLLAQIELRKLRYLPSDQWEQGIEAASDRLRQIMKHVSSLAVDLRPTSLDELGLASAMREHCQRLEKSFGIKINDQIEDVSGLSSAEQIVFYRIFQEAALNACKYSRSESLDVTLKQQQGQTILRVADYGIGFDLSHPEIRGGGLGLGGMRERASVIGATLDVSSAPGSGASVSLTLPQKEHTS